MFADAGMRERIGQQPLGVVANVSAWNYPYFVGGNVFVPALLTGNAVLYKPSEFATLTGLHIDRLLHAAGVPADVFITLVGGGEVGAALIEQKVDGVFFTGSAATGARIAAAVGPRMIRLQLELGGKDPTYVADDADPKAAAESLADGAMYNTGQSCCSVERIYVHEKIHDAFVAAFLDTVKGFKVGDPAAEGTYIGAITRAPQLAVLEAQVADAVAKGATLRTGGKRIERKGNWFEPTVFTDVDHRMLLMREESFGPLIGIQKVKDDAEALALMNDTRYGLTAGMYTPRRGAGGEAAGAGQRRQRLLELLRPGQPAPALVGARRLRRRRDAVALRHPDLHAAEGLAPAQPLKLRLALFDLDGTLLDGDTDELWCEFLMDEGVLDRADFEARNRSIVARYRAGTHHAGRVLRLLRVDAGRALARRLGGAAQRFVETRILPRIGGAARGAGGPPSRCRRAGGADDRDQPLPHRADRRSPSASPSPT